MTVETAVVLDGEVAMHVPDGSADMIIAGTRFGMSDDTYFIDGKTVDEAAWQERFSGARALSRAVSEIYEAYPIENG